MNTSRLEEICAKAVSKWGERVQIVIALEELGELSTELARVLRGRNDLMDYKVIEEMADVLVIVMQLRRMVGEFIFDETVDGKLNRVEERLNK